MLERETVSPQTLDCRAKPLSFIDRALAADRYGDIQTIIVDEAAVENARVVVERCWHDAAVTARRAPYLIDRAA